MTLFNQQLLGVDIGLEFIVICRIDCFGNLDLKVKFNTPKPAIPGAVSVAICEQIFLVDPSFQANLVGVCLPGQIDPNRRHLVLSTKLPGWIDVPLADWLEPRICRRVNLIWVQNQI